MLLPPEVVLSIHRILDNAQCASDALGTLDGYFDPIATLNELIPNGSSDGAVQLRPISDYA